ncbi:hypothetical protein [Foetidibacter luteolus]|uniref:hypothetical protein n=1 Tax=Foetidibacter luteolus TaxID=2608880 RepID=UPI00129A49EA|nr:hypothetical protein [Foetidibacter luteolus]
MTSTDAVKDTLTNYLLSGLLAGLAAVMANFLLFYLLGTPGVADVGYLIFNPFTIFYLSCIPPLLGALICYTLRRVKAGRAIYVVAGCAIFIAACVKATGSHYSTDKNSEAAYRLVLLAMIAVTGIFTVLITPLFIYKHKLTKKII